LQQETLAAIEAAFRSCPSDLFVVKAP